MANKVLRIRGSKYRTVLGLTTADNLDPLATYVLENILPVEPKLAMLKGIFGLHPRILEDVIADLLRRGRVSLNLEAGEVRVTESPAFGRAKRTGKEMIIWQDEHTGALLPWDLVKHFLTPTPEWQDLPATSELSFPPFPNLSVGHVLAALQPLVKGLRADADGWIVDALLERTFVETAELYVPLAELEIDGTSLMFVDCPELPAWVIAEWTRQLGSSQSGESDNTMASSVRRLLAPRRSPTSRQNLFPDADVANAAREWFSQFKTSLSAVEEPGGPMYEAHRAHGILNSYLRATGRIEMRTASGTNHLAELWRRAKFSLVIASPDWRPELLLRVLAETVSSEADHDAHLILLDGSADSRKSGRKSPLDGVHPERRQAGDVRTAVLRESLSGTYCLVDGRILRWGTMDTLLSSSTPLLEITGTSGISAISAAISARLPVEGRWWIDQHLTPNDLPNPETKETEGKSANLRAELKALMLEAAEKIAVADQARSRGIRPSAWRGGQQAVSANHGAGEVEAAFAESENTARQDLIEAARSLMQQLSDATFECPVAIRSPFETLVEICRFAENHPSKLTITIVVSSVPVDMPVEWANLLGALTSAANPVNIHICLTHPASNKSVDRLQKTFVALQANPVFSYSRSLLKLPNLVIVTGGEGTQRTTAVAISEGNWFGDRSQAPGIAFHSRELADRLTILIRE